MEIFPINRLFWQTINRIIPAMNIWKSFERYQPQPKHFSCYPGNILSIKRRFYHHLASQLAAQLLQISQVGDAPKNGLIFQQNINTTKQHGRIRNTLLTIAKKKEINTLTGFLKLKFLACFSSATTYAKKKPPSQKNTSTEYKQENKNKMKGFFYSIIKSAGLLM